MKLTEALIERQKTKGYSVESETGKLLSVFTQMYNDGIRPSEALSREVVSLESFSSFTKLSDDQFQNLVDAEGVFRSAFDTIAKEATFVGNKGYREYSGESFSIGHQVSDVSLESALRGYLVSGDIKAAAAANIKPIIHSSTDTENRVANIPAPTDATYQRQILNISKEAYNEASIRDSALFTMTYNYLAARQDEFGETLFPTIVQSTDMAGITINVKLMTVFQGVERNISGAFQNFNRKNIIRAVADSSILNKDTNKVIPVSRTESLSRFVDAAVIAASTVTVDGEAISTAPLKIGATVDLLGISQPASMVAKGTNDQTDSLEPRAYIENIYVTIDNGLADPNHKVDTIKISVKDIPYSNFVFNPQDNYKTALLNFDTDSMIIKKPTSGNLVQVDGSALEFIEEINTNNWAVRLKGTLTGSLNVETGELKVNAGGLSVYKVMLQTDGTDVSITSGAGQTLANDIASKAVVIGYDIAAWRTNANLRQRGQLINVTEFNQIYNVALRAPITAQHPISANQQIDSSDVQSLISTTRTRIGNEAVTNLLEFAESLKNYKAIYGNEDDVVLGPDILGIGRYFVKPQYIENAIDVPNDMNSLTSAERTLDIQAAIVNMIRNIAVRLYVDSEYKAAADHLSGAMSLVPTVVVATDPSIASYIMSPGDLRTLGAEFNLRVVSTLDLRMRGKIFVTFGVFDESRNNAPNALNFGNMIWYPETVVTANVTRNGQLSRETIVQPRYLFINNLPVIGYISVTGITEALTKQAVNFHTV